MGVGARRDRGKWSVTVSRALGRYAEATPQPLYCLLFLLPMVAMYEFGALMLRPAIWPERQLVAQNIVSAMLGWLGITGVILPGILLLGLLTALHALSRRPWRVHVPYLLLMAVESVVLTLPLLVLNRLSLQAVAFETIAAPNGRAFGTQLVMALGAGIYEEMVFRLILISGLLALFTNGMRAPRRPALIAAVVVGALLFAVCHVRPVGAESFGWPAFLIRTAGGAYLSIVFLWRGLGIAAGCHAAYNLLLIAL